MPLVCRYVPVRSRPRRYTAKDAGRIICYAVQNGASRQEIFDAAKDCIGEQCDCEKIERFLQTLLELLAGAAVAILLPESLLARLALPALRVLARALPGTRVAQLVKALEDLSDTKAMLGEAKQQVQLFLQQLK